MKNKTNQTIIIYILISLFIAIVSFKLLKSYTSYLDCYYYSFIKDIVYIITTGVIFKFILSKNDKRNTFFFEDLKKTNEKLNESNEKSLQRFYTNSDATVLKNILSQQQDVSYRDF